MSEKGGDTITFGKKDLSGEDEAYRQKVQSARAGVNSLKGSTPLGGIEKPRMPDFGQVQSMSGQSAPTGLSPDGGVQVRPAGSPVLSPQTQEQLTQMQAVQQTQAKAQEEELKKDVEENKEELFEAFDFMARNEAERVLNNKKRRKDIEARCSEMSIDDLVLKDEVQQTVPILPGKFEVTYRTMSPEESLFVKQFLSKETAPSEAYALEKFSLCQLACSLVAINNVDFPDHRKPDGTPDEDLFKVKLKKLMKKSGYVIADLGLNFIWFDIRVRKLLSPDRLGNS